MKLSKAKVKDYQYAFVGGKQYKLYDAFENPKGITKADYENNAEYPFKADVILVDMGKDAGRLRYGVFTRKTFRRVN